MCKVDENAFFKRKKLHQSRIIDSPNTNEAIAGICCDVNKKACMMRKCTDCKDSRLPTNEYEPGERVQWLEWKSGLAKREQVDNRGKKEALSVQVTTKEVVQGTTTQLVQDIDAELNQRVCRRQAVSGYAQLRNVFPPYDMPHYHDYDFPTPDFLIEPDGYLLLQSPDNLAVSNTQTTIRSWHLRSWAIDQSMAPTDWVNDLIWYDDTR